MNDLVVARFDGTKRASTVLSGLLQLAIEGKLDLYDAVAAFRTDDGELRIDESVQTTAKQAARWGVLLGGALGAAIAGPFTAGLSFATATAIAIAGALGGGTMGATIGARDASLAKHRYGIPDDFVQRVGELIQPGDSAVFAIVDQPHHTLLEQTLRDYGGEITRTTLAPEAVRHVDDTVGG